LERKESSAAERQQGRRSMQTTQLATVIDHV
jgi:hypothetical protein